MLRKLFIIPAVISASVFAALGLTSTAQAQDQYVAQMMVFSGNFCPRDWAAANGALLSIAQNTALFSLLGTTYGGNGQTTFALPNIQGRAPLGMGEGPGLPPYDLGEQGGAPSFTLLNSEMPAHTHGVRASNVLADRTGPATKYLGLSVDNQFHNGPANVFMAPDMLGAAGGSQPVAIREPFLAMTWCIAVQGVFPPHG